MKKEERMEERTMITRKKRMTLIVVMTIIFILLIATIFALLYLNTDMFKSNQTLFVKYLGQNVENIKVMEKSFEPTEFEQLLQTNPYTEESEIKVNYTKDIGTTSENTNNSINQLKVTVKGQNDKEKQYSYQDINLLKEEEKVLELECIQNDNLCGIRFSDLFQQFLLADNTNLKELFEKMGYTEEQLEKIPDTLINQQNREGNILFSEEEIEKLKEKYLPLIVQGIEKTNFEKQTKQTISVHQKNIIANSYSLKLTKEQLNAIYLRILENVKQDDIILQKIEKLQNVIDTVNLIYPNSIAFKEEFTNEIDKIMEQISQNNIGNEETQIIVYESNGQTIRNTIKGVDYEITIDFLNTEEEQYAEVSIIEDEEEIHKYILKNNAEDITFMIQNNENDTPVTITLEENKKVTDKNSVKNTTIRYEDDSNKIEVGFVQNINIVQEIENEVTLNQPNSIQLNTLEQEQLQEILNRVKEGVTNQEEKVKQEINIEEIQEVLKVVGILKDGQILEGTGVSETERNRFNSKYELLQGESMSSEDVIKIIETIEDNLKNMEVISNNELRLEISKNEKQEGIVPTLTTFLETEKNKKYDVKVEYDENGLVKYMTLTIVSQR